jgi:uncharacterized membrane protein
MNRSAPRSIDQYLRELKSALGDADPALVQDALYDAEEYLRAEVASHPDKSEADVLEIIGSTYGAPDEVASAYRTTEAQVTAALSPPKPPRPESRIGRFFAVYSDSRAWTALFYMVLSLATGIVYFTLVVTGFALSAGFAILIIGIPFFLLFIGLTRILSLAEGRLVEGLLGVRMPRRGPYPMRGVSLFKRIQAMLTDRRTWTTILYLILMLPLGIVYFTVAVAGAALSLGFLAAPVAEILHGFGWTSAGFRFDDYQPGAGVGIPLGLIVGALGVVLMTLYFHLIRALGNLHGQLAKALLVARDGV